MALKDTAKKMRDLLESIQHDLDKAEKGNKAAAQRVRTDSIKLEKIAKLYRKESIKAEKAGLMKRKPAIKKTAAKKPIKTTAKKTAAKAKPKIRTSAKKAPVKAKGKKGSKSHLLRK
ncbi:hypothetical protein BOKEGFJH_00636 [Chlamydia avium]|uniref:Histone H1-like protein Hc1 n=2 Tax=Chlamydia avium TaxID=1457141 RepID=W8JRP1_9CHLA|nr:histone H1-like protein Hc1 [Chlamydia avium]AHK63513.1 hypothetical protein M832_06500 [Chlamydia avium 10DC88]EPP37043.1 histone H1-like protein Hc1 [Chlamydia psittaci 10_743_SC13]EPP38932.1 histone H1-like protein Hc1 [Chlamydia avium]VVT43105.1 hypothetical protein BOKEGFJH_00636 [Chlamydia avium]